jgi:hypothetical protein
VVEVDERVGGPNLISQLFAGHDLSRPLEKNPEDLYRLALNGKTNPAVAQLAGGQIQLERTKPYNPVRTRGGHGAMP